VSTHDLNAEQAGLGISIIAVLSRFTACRIDDALLAEMADVLNEEFGSFLRRPAHSLGPRRL
jgi:hypothetical protein